MLASIPGNKEYIDYFFKNHRLFFCDSLPWKFYNYENGKQPRTNNLNVRLEYLFSRQGFFSRSIVELNNKSVFNEWTDYSYNFKNRRYIVQESISNNFHNPTHHSFKPHNKENNVSIDFSNPRTLFDNFNIATHPGNTRFYASSYLQKNLNKCFIYVHKDNYYDNMFSNNMKELTSVDEIFPYWKPLDNDSNNLAYDFVHISIVDNEDKRLVKGSKFHKSTDCSILKLWNLKDMKSKDKHATLGKRVLHTDKYINLVNESGIDIADIMFEKKLTIYTNSPINLKEYFLEIRKQLIRKAKVYLNKENHWGDNRYDFVFRDVNKFDFDVVVVDEKPNNISELNGNKGFAIWIDKDMVEKTNREIFEFLCFTRRDVKLAETKDGKISVVNCRDIDSNIKWVIHEEFLKCGVNTDER
jgi:hypothetical protein